MDTRKEVLFADLGRQLSPQSAINDHDTPTQWRSVPYETAGFKGTMVSATYLSKVPSLTLKPGLTGWYKISLGLYRVHSHGQSEIQVQLSGDKTYVAVRPEPRVRIFDIDEVFWKCADMTGQDMYFHQPPTIKPHNAALAFVRFVPVSEQEVADYRADRAHTDTRRIYATDDTHNMYYENPRSLNYFLSQVEQYRDSDVKVLSVEYVLDHDYARADRVREGRQVGRNTEQLCKETARWLAEEKVDYLSAMIDHGHEIGLDMYLSVRVNSSCYSYPLDENFYNEFYESHPELHQQDRDGTPISRLSFAYAATREHVLEQLSAMARYDCDGVDLIFNRGYPFVLFEQPLLDRVQELYGVDARTLPNDDERLMTARAEILTGFMRQVRARLTQERAQRGQKPLRIAVHVHKTIPANRFVGIDLAAWVREGLVNDIACYPVELQEFLPDEVYANEEKTLIDVDKYRQAVRESKTECHIRRYNSTDVPLEETRAMAEMVKGTGVNLYIDILPRQMTPEEFRKRAMELYDCGVEGISLWDTYERVKYRRQWTMMSRLGHKDELPNITDGEGELFRTHRILQLDRCRMDRYPPYWGG